MIMNADEKITLQFGRTLCEFFVEKHNEFFSCFSGKCGVKYKTKTKPEIIAKSIFPIIGNHSLLIIKKDTYMKNID